MSAPPDPVARSRWRRLVDVIDARTGYRAILRAAGDEPVTGGARFAYVFGSALVFTFVLQAVTGVALSTVYSPSVTDAWGSVYYIQTTMTLGWLVRGLHHFGSSAMIVLCILHMCQVFLYGAHRAPREANWVTGVIMLLLVLGLGLTGYLLPWDQKGYWATQVATSMMASVPGGAGVQELVQGGTEYGNLTLTRFYALHVFVLPGTLLLLVVGHIALFRRHGVTPHPGREGASLEAKTEPFWPFQMLRDVVVALVVLGILVALAVLVGASLEAPADPASGYEARPEWYFLFLFQLLKYFEGPLVLVGTVVIPGLSVLFLVAIPFLETRTDGPARPSRRIFVTLAALLLGAGVLTALALRHDGTDPGFQEARAAADAETRRVMELAELGGLDAEGRVVLYEGERLFSSKGCVSCHTSSPEDVQGPLLAGYGSRGYLERFLAHPDADVSFGKTVLAGQMEPFEGTDAQRADVAAYLWSLSGNAPTAGTKEGATGRGKALFDDGCTDCHNDPALAPGHADWEADAVGPDLAGFFSFEWTRALIRNAGHPRMFGDAIEAEDAAKAMPAFEDLTDDELSLLTRWLLAGAPGAE